MIPIYEDYEDGESVVPKVSPSTMTRQHFEFIADLIHSYGQDHDERFELAHHFAEALKQTNPHFKLAKFIERATNERS